MTEFVNTPEVYDIRAYGATPEMHETIADVLEERKGQDFQWGEQNHPMLSNWFGRPEHRFSEQTWKGVNAARVDRGSLAWDGILLEEVYELLSEEDPEKQYTEAIQVAAVALAIAQGIRRKQRG